jgi:hypothetical protein
MVGPFQANGTIPSGKRNLTLVFFKSIDPLFLSENRISLSLPKLAFKDVFWASTIHIT